MSVAIIEYGMGNVRSVMNALCQIGVESSILSNPCDLKNYDKIILPGVGAFGDGMKNLQSKGWIHPLEDEVKGKGKPFLGICLGMQLLATEGTEYGAHEGLNWVPGVVKKIPLTPMSLRIPHIGWNDVISQKKTVLFGDTGDVGAYYFIHSYVFSPNNQEVICGVCSYGSDFVASIEVGNIFATQFHPEKSHKKGLMLLQNFAGVVC